MKMGKHNPGKKSHRAMTTDSVSTGGEASNAGAAQGRGIANQLAIFIGRIAARWSVAAISSRAALCSIRTERHAE
jgi:hypothetical protein